MQKAPKALMETEWATHTMGSMVLGSFIPDDVVATIGARITHKCLLISKHTASPITFLLLRREARPLLVAIPLQRHLRLDIGLDTFRVKRLTHRSAADESPARAQHSSNLTR